MNAVDIRRFRGCRILVIGDLMLDEYTRGRVDRISPEAPVPVVAVSGETDTLGGAGNVVNNLSVLGAAPMVMGVVGDGRFGRRIREKLAGIGVDANAVISESGRPTTRKTRILAGSQQVLRIDRETSGPVRPETLRRLKSLLDERITTARAVLISDYGKGLLSRDFLRCILTSAERAGIPVFVDPKGRDYSRYHGATLLTPNLKEAGQAAGIDITTRPDLQTAAARILESSGVKNLLITRGAGGMSLFAADGKVHTIHADARQVFDVSGAGDTVISVLCLCAAAGMPLERAAVAANAAAGVVVGKVGTATVTAEELEEALSRSGAAEILDGEWNAGVLAPLPGNGIPK
ncbi:MAG: D-glycero-beta-D-manno-heptose-7-phosphate kinase [Desulfococcus sp.]|nr:MAG: D-glycero-beta-D-manno-heptose-7-phosphate kinase [Desulfococcus sp.]